jgi:hypothetical protein
MKPSLVGTVGLAVLLLLPLGRASASPLTAPIAHPGGPYTVTLGQSLLLDGSASTVPDPAFGQFILMYMWDIDFKGVFLPNLTSVKPTTTLPAAVVNTLDVGTHTLALKVTDSYALSSVGITTLTVVAASTPVPEPTATALLLMALAGLAVMCYWQRRGDAVSISPTPQ